MDICYSMEKVIDSCDMVANNLKPFQKRGEETGEAENRMTVEKRQEYIHNLFQDKYTELLKS